MPGTNKALFRTARKAGGVVEFAAFIQGAFYNRFLFLNSPWLVFVGEEVAFEATFETAADVAHAIFASSAPVLKGGVFLVLGDAVVVVWVGSLSFAAGVKRAFTWADAEPAHTFFFAVGAEHAGSAEACEFAFAVVAV